MESPTAAPPSPSRDAWMRRAGPFFPLLVATTEQTRLPVAADLSPTEEDKARAQPWSPLVGALLGLLLGFAAALIASLGLATTAVAALVASAWVIAGGAWAEIGVARLLDDLFSATDRADSGGFGLAISFTLSLVVSLILRVALLTSIEAGTWTAALLVSAAVARFAPLAAEHGPSLYGAALKKVPLPSWPLIACAGIVLLGLPIAVGYAALGAVVLALGAAVIVVVLRVREPAPLLVLAVELLALVSFAASGTYPLLK